MRSRETADCALATALRTAGPADLPRHPYQLQSQGMEGEQQAPPLPRQLQTAVTYLPRSVGFCRTHWLVLLIFITRHHGGPIACQLVIARRLAVPKIRTDSVEVIDYLAGADSQLTHKLGGSIFALVVHIHEAELSVFDAESSEVGRRADREIAELVVANLMSRR